MELPNIRPNISESALTAEAEKRYGNNLSFNENEGADFGFFLQDFGIEADAAKAKELYEQLGGGADGLDTSSAIAKLSELYAGDDDKFSGSELNDLWDDGDAGNFDGGPNTDDRNPYPSDDSSSDPRDSTGGNPYPSDDCGSNPYPSGGSNPYPSDSNNPYPSGGTDPRDN